MKRLYAHPGHSTESKVMDECGRSGTQNLFQLLVAGKLLAFNSTEKHSIETQKSYTETELDSHGFFGPGFSENINNRDVFGKLTVFSTRFSFYFVFWRVRVVWERGGGGGYYYY